jgi:hypothetical protein
MLFVTEVTISPERVNRNMTKLSSPRNGTPTPLYIQSQFISITHIRHNLSDDQAPVECLPFTFGEKVCIWCHQLKSGVDWINLQISSNSSYKLPQGTPPTLMSGWDTAHVPHINESVLTYGYMYMIQCGVIQIGSPCFFMSHPHSIPLHSTVVHLQLL